MKYFAVYKSGMDGISGAGGNLPITDALRELCCSDGWPSMHDLRNSILEWSETARPGHAFPTRYSIVVCVGVAGFAEIGQCEECGSECLEFGDMSPVVGDNVEQHCECLSCGRRWVDEFVFSERRELVAAHD